MLSDALREEISALLKSNEVVLFMKGTRVRPACGFSASVVQILDELLPDYQTINVLERGDLREGVKVYSSWPTIPQLFVRGELLGGADIVKEMYQKGELEPLLGVAAEPMVTPTMTITPAAAEKFREALADAPGHVLRFEIGPNFQYGLDLGARGPKDVEISSNGVSLVLDRASARRAEGTVIDFVAQAGGAGFKIDNPNAPPKPRPISAVELAQRLAQGEALRLYDVRSEEEQALAALPGAVLLTPDAALTLEGLGRETPLVFFCHHGQRSQAAAQHFAGLGFRNVYNLEGGIDAWSVAVDASVPRY